MTLDEVVPGQHVNERDEGDERSDAPGELRYQFQVAAYREVYPDQRRGDRMQNAKEEF